MTGKRRRPSEPRLRRVSPGMIGLSGFLVLGVSLAVIVASLGLSAALCWRHIARIARPQPIKTGLTRVDPRGTVDTDMVATRLAATGIVIFGQQLDLRGAPTPAYVARLEHTIALARHHPALPLFLLGGDTSGFGISEAAVGRDHLVLRGIPTERIHLEEHSRHTLENIAQLAHHLINNRAEDRAENRPSHRTSDPPHDSAGNRAGAQAQDAPQTLLAVSCPEHLARCMAMARNFGLRLRPHPAACARGLKPMAHEIFMLHWYLTGRVLAQITGHRQLLRSTGGMDPIPSRVAKSPTGVARPSADPD